MSRVAKRGPRSPIAGIPAPACGSSTDSKFERDATYSTSRQTRRVMAILALRDGPLLRVFVAGALWPDTVDERAAASLRSALWRLHRSGLTWSRQAGVV